MKNFGRDIYCHGWGFSCYFFFPLQSSFGILFHIRARQVASISFPVNYKLIILPFDYTRVYSELQMTFFKQTRNNKNKVKGKQTHYKPGQTLRFLGGWGSLISRQLSHEGGKVVSPTHWTPFSPTKYSWYSFLLEAEPTPGLRGGPKDYVNEK